VADPRLAGFADQTVGETNADQRQTKTLIDEAERMSDVSINTDRRTSANWSRNVLARYLCLALMAIAIVTLAVHFVAYLRYAWTAVGYPFELFEPEGIVWQQAMLIPGPRMYGNINQYPFIVFHYPPVYHLIVHAFAALGFDPLASGRAISLFGTLVIGALVSSLTFRAAGDDSSRFARYTGAAVAGLVFFCFYPVVAMSPLMRSDMPAIALSFLGVWFATRPARGALSLYLAMTVFVIAVYTKQTSIVAPLTMVVILYLVKPRLALKLCGFGLLVGSVPLAIMEWVTNGGFLRHLVLYNINRFSFGLLALQFEQQRPQFIFLALALISLFMAWQRTIGAKAWNGLADSRRDLASDRKTRFLAFMTLYLVLATFSLITVGKSGGGLNYFVEWMGILSVLIGMLFTEIVRWHGAPSVNRATITVGVFLPILLLAQLRVLPASIHSDAENKARLEELWGLVARIRDASKPVLSEDMVLTMRAGKQVSWEPAIFTELSSTGRWDDRHIIDLIDSDYFAFVITHGDDERHTPAVRRAIETAYPRIEWIGGREVRLPP
jgi:hypothetical protein